MILNLGDFPANSTVYVPFHTFDSNDPSASVTITGLAVTDIEIYKNGNVTQRASDSGYSLLDTDGIDFDGITGLHGFSIDLSDNADSGFFVTGATYWVAVSAITVDAATINFWAAVFTIEKTGGLANILTDTEALIVDTEAILVDSEAILADTEGSGAIATILTDTEAVLADTEASQTAETAILADTEAAITSRATILTDTEAVLADTEASQTAETSILADTEAVLADTEAASVAAIADQVWDELQSAHVTAGSFGEIATEIASVLTDSEAVLADTEAAITARSTILTDTEAVLADTEGGGALATILADSEAILADTEGISTSAILADTEAIIADSEAIKAKTDNLTFTVAGNLDSNIQYVNDVQVTGVGSAGDPWGP